jgi:hypothetical protein
MLKCLCEYPPNKENPKLVCKKHIRKKLKLGVYTQRELDIVVAYFEKNKRKLAEYVLLGSDPEFKPDILSATIFKKDVRKTLYIWKMADIVDDICTKTVKIRKSCTVIEIGPYFTFQRKGGDGGKLASNQFAFKVDEPNMPTTLAFKFEDF